MKLILVLSLLFSAFFSGLEIAFYQVNHLKVELEKNKGAQSARYLSYFINHPSRFITNTLIGNNIALVVYGVVFTKLFNDIFDLGIPALTFIVITLASTIIILVFSEFLPKALFILNPYRILKIFAFPYLVVYFILLPLNFIISSISKLLLLIPGVKVIDTRPNFDYYDLFHFVTSQSNDNDPEQEMDVDTEMIKKVIDLPNIKVRECLVPRTELVAIDINEDLDNLKRLFIKSSHSKILVYEENIDQIIGFVHMIDLYKNPTSIKEMLRPIIIVAEAMPANKLLKQFTNSNRSLGLVVDEYGGTAGLVTIEDLLEEIFGEIEDEYDKDYLREVKVNNKEFIFSARLEIDYLNEKYHLNIPDGDYETLGGFILEIYESFPPKNEIIKYNNLMIKILSAQENLIEEVQVNIKN